VLVDATAEQMQEAGGTQALFDKNVRPNLTVQLIKELHEAGVEPDVWKMEGLESTTDYEEVLAAAKEGERDEVGFVILGRGATVEKVKEWFQMGANVPGVIGFAVGRTIFWDSLTDYHEKKITREEASEQIANIFYELQESFVNAKK
jgi:myo-inositol catabolism protein IolC